MICRRIQAGRNPPSVLYTVSLPRLNPSPPPSFNGTAAGEFASLIPTHLEYLYNNQVDENFMFRSESFVQNRLIPIFILDKKWSISLL